MLIVTVEPGVPRSCIRTDAPPVFGKFAGSLGMSRGGNGNARQSNRISFVAVLMYASLPDSSVWGSACTAPPVIRMSAPTIVRVRIEIPRPLSRQLSGLPLQSPQPLLGPVYQAEPRVWPGRHG